MSDSEPKIGDLRIITDGEFYQVQEYRWSGILWWRKPAWRNLWSSDSEYGWHLARWTDVIVAEQYMHELIVYRSRPLRTWHVYPSGEEVKP